MELLAAVIGVTIGLMLIANAALQQVLGPVATLFVVHVTGLLLALPLAILVRTKADRWATIPWPLFLGGLVGVVLLLINNHTIPRLGAGLTVALGVVGQLLASAAVDHWGLFGLAKRRVSVYQVLGIGVAGLGVFVMTWGGK